MMSAITILVLFLALLAIAISATLCVVYDNLNRIPRHQEYSEHNTSLAASLSMGSIEKQLSFYPIEYFVEIAQVVPVAPVNDATPFDPLECDSDLNTFRFTNEGPSESYL
jgi:hypothetical protein